MEWRSTPMGPYGNFTQRSSRTLLKLSGRTQSAEFISVCTGDLTGFPERQLIELAVSRWASMSAKKRTTSLKLRPHFEIERFADIGHPAIRTDCAPENAVGE